MRKNKIKHSAPDATAPAAKASVKKRGRPIGATTKLTPLVQEEICKGLELAMPLSRAAGAAGVSKQLLSHWMKLGEQGIEPYAAFFLTVSRAENIGVRNMHIRALGGGKGSSQATWFLERRFKDEYGNVQRLEHTGHDGGAVQIQALATMSEEELKKLAEGT